jgi:hypothetical protein
MGVISVALENSQETPLPQELVFIKAVLSWK